MSLVSEKLEQLRDLILSKYETLAEYAREVGIVRQKLNKILKGNYVPKVSEARRMAWALGVSTDELAQFF